MQPSYTLKQLRTFVKVAQSGSVSETAESLHISQPAVSMQLRQLEESFAVALFRPQGRGIALTPAGEALLAYCLQVMASLKDLESVMAEHAGAHRGRICLGIVSTAKYFVPKVLAAFNQAYPEIEVSLVIDNKEAVFHQLKTQAVDLVISGRVPANLACEALRFADNPLCFVAHPEHALFEQKTPLSLTQLAEYPFIIREPGSGTRDRLESLFADRDLPLKVALSFPSNEVIKHAVMAKMGITYLSRLTLNKELKHGYLQEIKTQEPAYVGSWQVVHLTSHQLSPALMLFRQFLCDQGQHLIEQAD